MLHLDMNQKIEIKMGVLLSKREINKLNLRNTYKTAIFDLFGVDINLKTRKREFAEARYMYFALCKESKMGLREMGESVGKDHSTALHGLKRCKILCEVDPIFNNNFKTLRLYVGFKTKNTVNSIITSEKSLSHMFAESLKALQKLEEENELLNSKLLKYQIQ